MMMWRTTVTDLMSTLRDALRALAPHLSKVRIEWRDGASYDDWDGIAQLLYEKIVVASVLWALPESERSHVDFVAYDMMYDSYAGKTVIIVGETSDSERLVFHSFATREQPFDTVRARLVDERGRVRADDFIPLMAETATYVIETPDRLLRDLAVDV